MIEEPYRWVEAIANRREYIEHQLAGGSPIAALSYRDGILMLTLGRERQKLFEIHDRIAMGGIGHPGDIERLRMASIEVAGAEGFTRSSLDVSLRRLANYSLSSALKAAFEQIYGAPYLARMLFVELGRANNPNLFVRLDYDGSMHSSGNVSNRPHEEFGVVSGSALSSHRMESFLRGKTFRDAALEEVLQIALDAWVIGHLALQSQPGDEPPDDQQLSRHRAEQLALATIEVAVLERSAPLPMTWRSLSDAQLRPGFENLLAMS